MNRKLIQLFTKVVLVGILAAMLPHSLTAYAANAKISFSDPSVMVNNEVTVTMKIASSGGEPLGKADVMLSYDSSMLKFLGGPNAEGDAGSIRLQAVSGADQQTVFNFTLKFKAIKAGTAKITIASQEVYDADYQLVTVEKQGDSTVKIAPLATSSKDATLKSLMIEPGTLTPEFSPEIENYTASVGTDISKLVVNAVAANAGANVELQGTDLQAGDNRVICRVTAEDGETIKNYTITVTKAEGSNDEGAAGNSDFESSGLSVTAGGIQYAVASEFTAQLPEGFETTMYSYKGTEVMAGRGLEKELTLLYLTDAEGGGGFFIYNEASDSFAPFISIEVTAKAVVAVPLDEGVSVPKGLVPCVITIGDTKVDGWVWESDSNNSDPDYCIIYGMNWNGEKGFYRYDRKEQTIQRFFQDGVSAEEFRNLGITYNRLIDDYDFRLIIIIVLAVFSVISVILVIILALKGTKSRERGSRKTKEPYVTDDDYYIEDEDEQAVPLTDRDSEGDAQTEDGHMLEQPDRSDDDFEELEIPDDAEQALGSNIGEKPYELKESSVKKQDEDDDFEMMDLF